MSASEEQLKGLAQGWSALGALHARIEARIEKVLQSEHRLSAREYSVLDVLNQQDDFHLRMNQLADMVVLSQSATTRLVTRLEERGLLSRYLCATDRRGIYTEVTPAGRELLAQARPGYQAALREALDEAAAKKPEFAPLVAAVEKIEVPVGA
ncbi:MarR family winged helix-turn-helix transcriptional regulator [Streptomyces boninensis]|uniref:MarR family winged helix-turn-helix transcriptional regulator n=1 Tax=Streptomyces boninensis TaxID=2039455 RepID=UPI003B218C07